MQRWIILILAMMLLGLPMASAQEPDACAGLVEPRLAANVTARAAFNDGIGVTFRSAPGTDESGSQVLANFAEGVIFTITGDAPICQDGFVWWAVRLPDGQTGFIAEGAAAEQSYFVEPFEVGLEIYQQDDITPNQYNRWFVDSRGNARGLPPVTVPLGAASNANNIWQASELEIAVQVLTDRANNCPDQLTEPAASGVSNLTWDTPPTAIYPAPEGNQVLVIRDYLVSVPDCDEGSQQYGTSTVSLLDTLTGEERLLFPFSQHSDPPESAQCQPPVGAALDHPIIVSEVEWSPDGQYVGLVVRYLRNSEAFPCAFFHVFTVNVGTGEVTPIGEGRRIGWGQGGRRLRYVVVERTDPNEPGTERLVSVIPTGADPLEIFIPGGGTWLPDATLMAGIKLPWTDQGDRLLVCNGRVYGCGETLTFQIVDSAFVNPIAILAPTDAQLGLDLAKIDYVAGDTQLLWLNTAGTLYLQPIDGDEAGIWNTAAPEALAATKIVDFEVLPTGIGAVLTAEDGQLFYLDVLTNSAQPIQTTDQP